MNKDYKLDWKNGKLVSIVVNGVQYDDPAQITDVADRAAIVKLMAQAADADTDAAWEIDDKKFDEEFSKIGRPSVALALAYCRHFPGRGAAHARHRRRLGGVAPHAPGTRAERGGTGG